MIFKRENKENKNLKFVKQNTLAKKLGHKYLKF